jgi:ATP-dependent DNA helicase RecG
MNKEEIDFILEKGEGYFIEFKESFDKSLSKEIVAFANSSGGRIFLGVNDNNIIKGITITNKLKSQIIDIANNIQPSIDIRIETTDDILIINIPEGINKPYQCKDSFFLRIGANSQKMNREQIIEFLQFEGKIKFEEQFNRHFDFDKHYSGKKIKRIFEYCRNNKELR